MIEFEGWTDEEVQEWLTKNGMPVSRKLEDGTWISLYPLMFTLSVCMGVGQYTSYMYRWCFEDREEALLFFLTATEFDEVPAPEHRKSLKGHRYRRSPLLVEKDENGYDKW